MIIFFSTYIRRSRWRTLSDELAATLAEAGKGLKACKKKSSERDLIHDPASIQAAIEHVETVIDAKVARFRGNALVRETAEQIKAECRANILAQVEAASIQRGTRTLH
jgi:hypothetical protein